MSKRIDVYKEVIQAELDVESTQNKLKNIDSQENIIDEIFYENQQTLRIEQQHELEIKLVEATLGEKFQSKVETQDEQIANLTDAVIKLYKITQQSSNQR